MRADVLMAVNIQIIVLCNITQCSLVERYQLCNNKTKHPYMMHYYSNQKAIHFSCTRQPSSSFKFQKYKKEIHIAVALHTRVQPKHVAFWITIAKCCVWMVCLIFTYCTNTMGKTHIKTAVRTTWCHTPSSQLVSGKK